MTASVRSVGTPAFGTGAVAPGLPAGTALDDVLILAIETANEATDVAAGNPEWTLYSETARGGAGVAGGTRIRLYWARASAVVSAPNVPDSGDHTFAVILAVKDCLSSGDPFGATVGVATGALSGTATCASLTTLVDDCLVMYFCAVDLDADSTAQFGTVTNVNLTSITEHFDQVTSTASGGGLGIFSGVKATAGATGTTTVAMTSGSVWAALSLALKPAAIGNAAARRRRGVG